MLMSTVRPVALTLGLAFAAPLAVADVGARLDIDGVTPLPALSIATDRPVDLPWSPTQMRTGAVDLDMDVLAALAKQESAGATIEFFDDATFTVRPTRVELRGDTSFSLSASVDEIQGGTMILVREGDTVFMNVWAGALGAFEVRTTPEGQVVEQIDQSRFPDCETPEEAIPAIEGAGAPTEGNFCVDDGSEIKVLILFTPASVAGIGGAEQMLGFAQMCILATNQSYENSGVAPRAVLAGFSQVDYAESGDGFTDRDRLTNPNDGFIDEIHDLRDQVGADVVSMIVNNIGACGVANFSVNFGNNGFPFLAFNVTRRDCAIGNLSFPHELGHNQGSRHDRAADPNAGAFDYSHGFVAPNGAFRTVMATSNLFAPRIPYFSNPDVNFGGQPTGVATNQPNSAHNMQSLNNTAIIVANFRTDDCTVPGDFNGDGLVNGTDLAILLSVWGTGGQGTGADLNGDGVVNGGDLAFVLANWTGN